MANSTSGYRLADVKRTQHVFTNSGVFNNNNKKAAHNLRTNLNTFTEEKAKKINSVFSALHGNYILPGSLLPVPEERLLPFSFVRKRVVVRVKEHDVPPCVWLSERFRQGTC